MQIRLREALEAHRQRTGERLTYEQLADRTGLSRQTVESIASRQDYNSTLTTVAKLCNALRCEPADLLVLRSQSPDEH
ncbi:MAG: helix-turn-helix transcriptional regulator [Acidobacteria bacterium]|nr:helix-turn-helix transcriptional regulator [Acidobacteriota bacterium]